MVCCIIKGIIEVDFDFWFVCILLFGVWGIRFELFFGFNIDSIVFIIIVIFIFKINIWVMYNSKGEEWKYWGLVVGDFLDGSGLGIKDWVFFGCFWGWVDDVGCCFVSFFNLVSFFFWLCLVLWGWNLGIFCFFGIIVFFFGGIGFRIVFLECGRGNLVILFFFLRGNCGFGWWLGFLLLDFCDWELDLEVEDIMERIDGWENFWIILNILIYNYNLINFYF